MIGRLTAPVDPASDHIRGPLHAPVTLVEYGDFECPYCTAAYPEVRRAIAAVGEDTVCFVFRHLPLAAKHPHAEIAAEAAEAAGAQGRFWEMHDMLFEAQGRLAREDLERYAGELGLDLARFRSDLDSHAYLEKIREQAREGIESGAPGTPTFFIDGEIYTGSPDAETLGAALLARAGGLA